MFDLASIIVDYNAPDLMLPYLQRKGYISTDYGENVQGPPVHDLEYAIYRHLLDYDPVITLAQIVNDVTLIRLANDCIENGSFMLGDNKEVVARAILESLNIPIKGGGIENSGLQYCQQCVREVIDKLIPYMTVEDFEEIESDLRDLNLSVWAEVEELLKLILIFYRHSFINLDDTELDEIFNNALLKKSLGPILHSMKDVQNSFQPSTINQQGSEQTARLVKRRQWECDRKFKRVAPFTGLDIDTIIKLINPYRNVYAHRKDSIIKDLGVSQVLASVRALEGVLSRFAECRICPIAIVLIGRGEDAYNREIYYYVEEKDSKVAKYLPKNIRWLYKPGWKSYQPHGNYYLLSYRMNGCYDPMIFPQDEILQELKSIQGN
ncbi:MAG: hypothetical protein EXR62_09440 [Chloroflexi bacterium]|nr:hypothetical protein [Chloroflexota bacterium]